MYFKFIAPVVILLVEVRLPLFSIAQSGGVRDSFVDSSVLINKNKNTLHYTTLHYTTLHYNTIQYTTLHYTTLQYNTIQYNTNI